MKLINTKSLNWILKEALRNIAGALCYNYSFEGHYFEGNSLGSYHYSRLVSIVQHMTEMLKAFSLQEHELSLSCLIIDKPSEFGPKLPSSFSLFDWPIISLLVSFLAPLSLYSDHFPRPRHKSTIAQNLQSISKQFQGPEYNIVA